MGRELLRLISGVNTVPQCGAAAQRIETLGPLAPDPCRPWIDEFGDGSMIGTSVRRSNYRRRKAQVLGATRQLVTEGGLDHVRVHAVAQRAGVSIPTLYKLIGGRSELLICAATEFMVALARNVERDAIASIRNSTFTLLETFWVSTVVRQGYATNLIRDSKAAEELLEVPIVDGAQAIIERQLCELKTKGLLTRWSDPRMLARQLAISGYVSTREWLHSPYSEERYRETIVNSCGLLLRGAVCGAEIERVERGLSGE